MRNAAHYRDIITELNRADLPRMAYKDLLKRIGDLIDGVPLKIESVAVGQALYRGIRYTERPSHLKQLSAPPPDKVVNYQRCNGPGHPMFYAAVQSATVFAELGSRKGDLVYLSVWEIVEPFLFIRIPLATSDPALEDNASFARVSTFLETRFMQPVAHAFSDQYKITAAAAEKLSNGPIAGDTTILNGQELSAVAYPSVAHVARAQNVAIRPEIVAKCMRMKGVREIEVFGRTEAEIHILDRDFATAGDDGVLVWQGRPQQWPQVNARPLTARIEGGEWVLRDEAGNVVDSA